MYEYMPFCSSILVRMRKSLGENERTWMVEKRQRTNLLDKGRVFRSMLLPGQLILARLKSPFLVISTSGDGGAKKHPEWMVIFESLSAGFGMRPPGQQKRVLKFNYCTSTADLANAFLQHS